MEDRPESLEPAKPAGPQVADIPERLRRFLSRQSPHPVGRRLRLMADTLLYLFGREATVLISSIAFSFLFSLFPVIVLLLTFAHVLEWHDLRSTIFEMLYRFFPISQEFIVSNLRIYTRSVGQPQLLSLILLAWAGSTFFFALEAGLDSAYRVPRYRKFVYSQVLGTVVVVLFGMGVLAALVWFQVSHIYFERLPGTGPILRIISDFGVSFLLTLLLFLGACYYLPNRRLPLVGVLPEALVGAVLWMVGNLMFRQLAPGWAVSLQSVYGPFFVSMILLLWAYFSGCILLGCARLAGDGFFSRISSQEGLPPRGDASRRDGEFSRGGRDVPESRRESAVPKR